MKKILLICSLLIASLAIYAQENLRDDIKDIFNDESLTPVERLDKFDKYCIGVDAFGFEESDIPIFHEIVFPFIDKELKDASSQNYYRAVSHHFISWIYQGLADFEQQGEELAKALLLTEKIENKEWRAFIYSEYGIYLIKNEDMKTGHEYMYKSIELYNEIGNVHFVIMSLWWIAVSFQEIRDAEGLKRIFTQMESYAENNKNVDIQYHINSIKAAYYDVASDKCPDNQSFMDSSFILQKENIYLIENHIDELAFLESFCWEYHNFALSYRCLYPENYDTILYYLNKALEFGQQEVEFFKNELEISVYISFAEIHFEQGHYEQAEKDMLYALTLSEKLKDRNNLIAEFHEIYKFFVTFYEKTGNPTEALKYQKLLQENAEKRYDNDKIQAINDMSVKYETEKKEAKIAYLELENQTARRIIMLVAALLVLLIIAVVFIVINNRLRKKNLQQSIYETALLNELQQTELEKTEDEKQLLQQEYDKLNELAGESQKKAEEYAAQLQSIKQQLELKPTQTMAQKIQEMISKSLIDNYHKKEYLENLSKLDIDMLEQGFLTADEKITNMDMKYLICFAADMESKDISLIFNIEPASVRTVRYRIKKKFQEKNTFKFLV